MRDFVIANRHGVLNYTRVRTGFTSGDDKWWTTMLFFYSLWEHIATLSLFLTHTLSFSLCDSHFALYRTIVPAL